MRILSPMPAGSGAWVVHQYLAQQIPGYELVSYDPRLTLFPPLLRLVPRPAADIVHTTPDHGALLAQKGTPLVVTFHNYVLDQDMGRHSGPARHLHNRLLLRPLTQRALQRARAVTAVSRYTAGLVQRDLQWVEPVRVIHNGVDETRFTPGEAGEGRRLRVLYCGNLIARKGVALIPAILDRLDPHVEFAYTSGLRTSRDRIPHARAINLGRVEYRDMPAVYRSADILLFPTRREGFGLAVAEAMACGLPVVASNCSSIPELVEDNRGGFLCPPDSAQAFADGINRLAADPALRRDMGAWNRARVESLFTLQRMIDAYRVLFEEVMSMRRAG